MNHFDYHSRGMQLMVKSLFFTVLICFAMTANDNTPGHLEIHWGKPLSSIKTISQAKPKVELAKADEPLPMPHPTITNSYIKTKQHAEIIWTIWQLESSRGMNDGCRNKGQVNGFGFAQSKHVWRCYQSFEQVVDLVDNWLSEQLASKDLATTLCYYNLGQVINHCNYAENYQKVLKNS